MSASASAIDGGGGRYYISKIVVFYDYVSAISFQSFAATIHPRIRTTMMYDMAMANVSPYTPISISLVK